MSTAGWGPCPEKSNTSIDSPWPHNPSPTGPVPLTGLPNWEKDNPPAFKTAGRMHMSPRDYNAFLQMHLSAVLGQRHNSLRLSPAQFTHLHTAYPSTNTSDRGYGYTYGGWIRRNFTVDVERISALGKTPLPEYVLLHDGSNTLNFAFALLDSYAGEAYVALTNVGGSEADVGVQEAIIGMRNGTLRF
jgi:CubicO group peptidase (beta-lactamase class C family)